MSTTPEVPTPTDAAPPLDDPGEELLRGLEVVDGLPVAGHPAVYEAVHDRMRNALATSPDAAS